MADAPENPVEVIAENGSATRGRLHAYEQIRQAIVEGRYAAGQRLIEKRLGEEFEVSRTPVREALRMLESEGLVLSLPNKGSVVRPLTAHDIYDIYELRVRLESLAAERAARHPRAEQLEVLESANADFAAILPSFTTEDLNVLRQITAINHRFHQGLLDMADSWRLSQLLARTVHAVLVFQNFQSYTHEELGRSLMFHQLIAQAVGNQEPERAGNLIAEHIMLARDILVERRAESVVDGVADADPASDEVAT
jgi:DNA-binding GntR family transcriptional regulator